MRIPIGSGRVPPSAPDPNVETSSSSRAGAGPADTGAIERGFARTDAAVDRLELLAADLAKAPPSFAAGARQAVFVDFQAARTKLVFDVASKKIRVQAEVEFLQTELGGPIIDLKQKVLGLVVDGKPIEAGKFRDTAVPDEKYRVTMIDQDLPPGRHTVQLEYELPEGPFLQLDPDGARFFQVANDLLPGRFSEQFFPSNFEFDQYPHTLQIQIKGGTRPHRVMANGAVQSNADGSFTVAYPPYFNTASFYLDLVDPAREVIVEKTVHGLGGDVPVVIYGKDARAVAEAVETFEQCFHEYEAAFGAYPHQSFVGRIVGGDQGGGMEYSGAAVMCGGVSTIRHEVLHSWFARSVMPASGNDGWIDEAIATWLGSGSRRADSATLTEYGGNKLTGFSPYTRATPVEAYEFGNGLMRQLDFVFRDQGGVRAQLRALFAAFQNQTITTGMLEDFLQARTEEPLRPLFDFWVYGRHLRPDAQGKQELSRYHSRNMSEAAIARSCIPDHGFAIEPASGNDKIQLAEQVRRFLGIAVKDRGPKKGT